MVVSTMQVSDVNINVSPIEFAWILKGQQATALIEGIEVMQPAGRKFWNSAQAVYSLWWIENWEILLLFLYIKVIGDIWLSRIAGGFQHRLNAKHTVMLGSNTVSQGGMWTADSYKCRFLSCQLRSFDKCWGFKRVKRCKQFQTCLCLCKPWQSLWPMALMVGSLNMTVLAESQIQVNAVEEKVEGACWGWC